MKISYDLGFIAIGVAIAMQRCHYVFYLSLCFSVPGVFFKKSLKGICTCHNYLNYGKVSTNSMRAFLRYFERSFKHHKNSKIACYPHN